MGGVKGGVESVLQGLKCKGRDGTGQAEREDESCRQERCTGGRGGGGEWVWEYIQCGQFPFFPLSFLPSLLASPSASIPGTSLSLSAPCPLHSTWRTALG